jgi:regulator of protease activity HflC (stomatin/prohibitin superfamily)
LLFK